MWNETIKTGIAFKMDDEVFSGDLKLLHDGSCWITGFIPKNNSGRPHDIEISLSEIEDYSGAYKKVEVHEIKSGIEFIEKLSAFNPEFVIDHLMKLF